MRIIKLSPNDVDMYSREMVDHYFQFRLNRVRPVGQFLLTKRRIAENGISPGEMLIFSYRGEIVYLALAASSRMDTEGQEALNYPYYFCVDVDTIVPGRGTLNDLEEALAAEGLLKKNIVRSRGWPIIEEENDTLSKLKRIWGAFRIK